MRIIKIVAPLFILALAGTVLWHPSTKEPTTTLVTQTAHKIVATPSPTPTPIHSNVPSPTIDLQGEPAPKPPYRTEPDVTPKPQSNKVSVTTPTPSDSPLAQQGGVWTPYNPNCFADCFPDLTSYWVNQVMAVYQGSFDTPSGPGGAAEFKGLLGTSLDHYTCEYAHVVGDLTAIEACKGIL